MWWSPIRILVGQDFGVSKHTRPWHPCCSLAWLSVAEDHSSLYTAVSAGYVSMCLPVGGTACVVPDAVVPVHPFVGDQNAAVAKGLVAP